MILAEREAMNVDTKEIHWSLFSGKKLEIF